MADLDTAVAPEATTPKAKKEKKVPEGPVCSVCGKPLTDPESVKQGIGPQCRANGWTQEAVTARLGELTRTEVPEGWIKLADVHRALVVAQIPVARMVRAVGGDRGMKPALSPMYSPIYVGRTRYLPPESISPEGFAFLQSLTPAPRPKKEKPPKPEKPAKEGKKAKGVVDADAFMAEVFSGEEPK